MKNYNQTLGEAAFLEACQQMNSMKNAAINWFCVAMPTPLQTVTHEQGCLRSVRLARLKPVSHELTSQSVLQIVVLPASFDTPGVHAFAHQRWHLLVYSWLDSGLTQSLIAYWRQRFNLAACTFLRVAANGCETTNPKSDEQP